jgi:hypothetical protein
MNIGLQHRSFRYDVSASQGDDSARTTKIQQPAVFSEIIRERQVHKLAKCRIVLNHGMWELARSARNSRTSTQVLLTTARSSWKPERGNCRPACRAD